MRLYILGRAFQGIRNYLCTHELFRYSAVRRRSYRPSFPQVPRALEKLRRSRNRLARGSFARWGFDFLLALPPSDAPPTRGVQRVNLNVTLKRYTGDTSETGVRSISVNWKPEPVYYPTTKSKKWYLFFQPVWLICLTMHNKIMHSYQKCIKFYFTEILVTILSQCLQRKKGERESRYII